MPQLFKQDPEKPNAVSTVPSHSQSTPLPVMWPATHGTATRERTSNMVSQAVQSLFAGKGAAQGVVRPTAAPPVAPAPTAPAAPAVAPPAPTAPPPTVTAPPGGPAQASAPPVPPVTTPVTPAATAPAVTAPAVTPRSALRIDEKTGVLTNIPEGMTPKQFRDAMNAPAPTPAPVIQTMEAKPGDPGYVATRTQAGSGFDYAKNILGGAAKPETMRVFDEVMSARFKNAGMKWTGSLGDIGALWEKEQYYQGTTASGNPITMKRDYTQWANRILANATKAAEVGDQTKAGVYATMATLVARELQNTGEISAEEARRKTEMAKLIASGQIEMAKARQAEEAAAAARAAELVKAQIEKGAAASMPAGITGQTEKTTDPIQMQIAAEKRAIEASRRRKAEGEALAIDDVLAGKMPVFGQQTQVGDITGIWLPDTNTGGFKLMAQTQEEQALLDEALAEKWRTKKERLAAEEEARRKGGGK